MNKKNSLISLMNKSKFTKNNVGYCIRNIFLPYGGYWRRFPYGIAAEATS